MPDKPLQQSALRRAWEDMLQFFHKLWGFLVVEVIAMGMGVVILAAFIPQDASQFISAVFQFVGAILGFLVGLLLIFITYLILAPYRQRNEARNIAGELHNQVTDLTTPKLLVKLLPLQLSGFMQGRVFCLLEVSNQTMLPISDCYGMLEEFKPSQDMQLQLPKKGHKYPWSTHGLSGKQLCSIASQGGCDLLDILIFENNTMYTPVLASDGFTRDKICPMPYGIYGIRIRVGSESMPFVPTKISLRVEFTGQENIPIQERVKVSEITND